MKVLLLSCLLPIKLDNGNTGRGKSWRAAMSMRRRIESELRLHRLGREPFEEPVTLEVVRILGPGEKLWDFDSIGRGNAKELIDSLVAIGWFHDDKPQWIRGVVYDQHVNRNVGPATWIKVYRWEPTAVVTLEGEDELV